jgi:uncharacterized damage-inducible protein DinB
MDLAQTIRTLIDYNQWANDKILAAAGRLSDAELERPLPGAGHGSILGQLRHVVQTQAGWHTGLTGQTDSAEGGAAMLAADSRYDFTSRAGVWRAYSTAQDDLRALGHTLTAEQLAQPFLPHRLPGMTLGEVMVHTLLHAQHHRGETAALLTGLGHSPGDVDLLFFLFARGA